MSKMMSVTIEVTFSVAVNTEPGETVCVIGNVDQLGNWNPNCALRMRRESSSPRVQRKQVCDQNGCVEEDIVVTQGDVWKKKVKFVGMEELQYRYFVCKITESDNEESERHVNVLKYEANLQPRTFSPSEYLKDPSKYDANMSQFGNYGGETYVNKGWLTDQSEIQLNLHSNPIHMWKRQHRNQTYRIKCTPIDNRYRDHGDDDEIENDFPDYTVPPSSFSQIFVSVLRDGNDMPCLQQNWGEVYRADDFMVFTAQTTDPERLGFQFDFFVETEDGDTETKHVGYCFVLPTDLKLTNDSKTIPITGLKHKPIGQLKLDYLIAKPVSGLNMKMDVSYQNYWKLERGPVDVGHRGMGSSYKHKKLAAVRENTVTSLQSAGSHGADLVEFDVQLSKDMVPVIYHDFHVCITYRKKKRDDLELFKISVKDLNLSQLQSMKLSHVTHEPSEHEEGEMYQDDLDPADLQPFPTLQRCFEAVDVHVGFNVEVKYPQQKKDGVFEDDNLWDRNKYIDTILRVCFQSAGKRRIIFSTFDPDMCILLRLKQNRYPVLFLTNGETNFYTPYNDIRTQSVVMAKYFANFSDILGIDVFTEVLMKNPDLIKMVKDSGMVLFCWGEDNNDTNTISKLKEQGVDGIIYDRIDFYKGSKEGNIFKLEDQAKKQLLQQLGAVTGHDDSGSDSTSPQ